MPAFYCTLTSLYDLAERMPPDSFLAQAMRLLHEAVGFDGAVLSLGKVGTRVLRDASARGVLTDALESAEQRVKSAVDRVLSSLTGKLPRVARWHRACADAGLEDLDTASIPLSWRRLLVFGEGAAADMADTAGADVSRWLLLYRESDDAWQDMHADYVQAGWAHLVRALDLNLARTLDLHDSGRDERAQALVDERGMILAADAYFRRLLLREWPACTESRLPAPVTDSIQRGKRMHRGRSIELGIARHPGYVLCTAVTIRMSMSLSPGEYLVACRYAAGLSHKEIARELCLSPHTVRNQIAHLYGKLDVHDKAELAQRLAPHAVPSATRWIT